MTIEKLKTALYNLEKNLQLENFAEDYILTIHSVL